jgi:hypothetical protein
MPKVNLKKFIQEYFDALSVKPKPLSLLEKYISDAEFINHITVRPSILSHLSN